MRGARASMPGLCDCDHSLMTMDKMMEIPAGEFKAKCLQKLATRNEKIIAYGPPQHQSRLSSAYAVGLPASVTGAKTGLK
jgi:hypothetical protein